MHSSITRRQFIKATAVSTAAAYLTPSLVFDAGCVSAAEAKSQVIIASHSGLVGSDEKIVTKIVRTTVDETLVALTNTTSVRDAWMRIFPNLLTNDVIGIKVNCINRSLASHPEVVYALAESLTESLQFNPNHIIIWDRTNNELERAKYTINTEDQGIRCFGTYGSRIRLLDKLTSADEIVGYDESFSVDVGNGRHVHLSRILTKACDYLINVPVLKDHGTAGVTLSMKNHYGSIDSPGSCHGGYCNPYVANLNATPQIRAKTKLILCDALFGIYRGGPGGAPQWINRQLLASFDPVALDATGMTLIEHKRSEKNLSSVVGKTKYIQTAAQLGLGNADSQRIDLVETRLG